MHPLPGSLGQTIPTIVVQHEEKGFAQKHRGIQRHHLFERRAHVRHEHGIERQERDKHDTAKQGRDRERDHPDAKNVATKAVVALGSLRITTREAQELQEERKQRQRQDEPAEIGMLLRDEPDDDPVIERLPIWVGGSGFHGRGALRDSFGLIIDVLGEGRGIRTGQPRHGNGERTAQDTQQENGYTDLHESISREGSPCLMSTGFVFGPDVTHPVLAKISITNGQRFNPSEMPPCVCASTNTRVPRK